jgi:cytochrome P450
MRWSFFNISGFDWNYQWHQIVRCVRAALRWTNAREDTAMPLAPIDDAITFDQLTKDPYPIYKRLRAEAPVSKVAATGRTFITKAADTRAIKDNAELWSSDDPDTPMERAFQAQTLMRKDGAEHLAERMAMQPTFMPGNLKNVWGPLYETHAAAYLDRLPSGEVVDLYPALAGPLAARILAEMLGIPEASDADMQRWSQDLIDGAGNFSGHEEPFERTDKSNVQMNALFDRRAEELLVTPDQSALSVMLNADTPIARGQMYSNIKIAIGGGINEPRDALLTILYGLLSNPDQLEAVKAQAAWGKAFEEGVRWVAPIQVSSRRATMDTQVRGIDIPKGDVIMTIQASANHDEELFEDGHLFNAFRDKNPHQSFGSGPHHCAGAHTARMMLGRILLPMIFERFPNMELAGEDVIWSGFGFRGPLNLPVKLN